MLKYTKSQQLQSKPKKKRKVKLLGMPQLKAKVQRAVNKYCRDRDEGNGCISCGKHLKLQGGHYIPQGSCSYLRYDFDNINGQCVGCNKWKSGNLIEYRIRLVKKISAECVELLEGCRVETKKGTRQELEELLERLKRKSEAKKAI